MTGRSCSKNQSEPGRVNERGFRRVSVRFCRVHANGGFPPHATDIFTDSGHSAPLKLPVCNSLQMEARVGIEPTNAAFAEPCLTTWLPRLTTNRFSIRPPPLGSGRPGKRGRKIAVCYPSVKSSSRFSDDPPSASRFASHFASRSVPAPEAPCPALSPRSDRRPSGLISLRGWVLHGLVPRCWRSGGIVITTGSGQQKARPRCLGRARSRDRQSTSVSQITFSRRQPQGSAALGLGGRCLDSRRRQRHPPEWRVSRAR